MPDPSTPRAPAARGRGRSPNLLVIVLDCVRAGSVAPSTHGRIARTPHIDRIRGRGSTFTRAVAPGNWTIPSHMSITTGTYPWVHRRRTFRSGPPPTEPVAAWLARRGYDTAMFTEETHLVAGYGLEDGYAYRYARRYETTDEERTLVNRLVGHSGLLYSVEIRRLVERLPPLAIPMTSINYRQEIAFKRSVCGPFLVDEFDRWLAQRDGERPFHGFFNFVDGHEPYVEDGTAVGWAARRYARVPRFYLLAVPGLAGRVPWAEVERRYLRAIESADEKVGRILAALDRAGELGRTLIIVTADHGQSFGEHGNIYHGCGASDSVARVPLVVGYPDGMALPARVDDWVSLCEIPSYLKSAALGQPAFDETGAAPVPFPTAPPARNPVFCEGGPASDPNYSLRGIGLDRRWNHRLLAAYAGDTKWVLDLATEELSSWRVGDADEHVVAPGVQGEERLRTLASVYGIFSPSDLQRYRADAGDLTRPPLKDDKMRSWGYD
ncbi:MAG: sulfatase-like hydrolase/transferase [Thermoplasmata archaeon]|nr:sulfatase-like hydrolase/transferase [Thermoplasmata archaeon]